MELMRSVDEMIAQLNEAKQLSDTTSVTTICTNNTTQEKEMESSESEWWSGQGQSNRNKINSEVDDSLSITNDFELFVTQQVYTSIDTCLNGAVTEEAEALSIAQLSLATQHPKRSKSKT